MPWGECSEECGGTGIMARNRTCSNPPPSEGTDKVDAGRDCNGISHEEEHCNFEVCPGNHRHKLYMYTKC